MRSAEHSDLDLRRCCAPARKSFKRDRYSRIQRINQTNKIDAQVLSFTSFPSFASSASYAVLRSHRFPRELL